MVLFPSCLLLPTLNGFIQDEIIWDTSEMNPEP